MIPGGSRAGPGGVGREAAADSIEEEAVFSGGGGATPLRSNFTVSRAGRLFFMAASWREIAGAGSVLIWVCGRATELGGSREALSRDMVAGVGCGSAGPVSERMLLKDMGFEDRAGACKEY